MKIIKQWPTLFWLINEIRAKKWSEKLFTNDCINCCEFPQWITGFCPKMLISIVCYNFLAFLTFLKIIYEVCAKFWWYFSLLRISPLAEGQIVGEMKIWLGKPAQNKFIYYEWQRKNYGGKGGGSVLKWKTSLIFTVCFKENIACWAK